MQRPSGKGWQPIPGGKRGGFRKPSSQAGRKWDYWYPDEPHGRGGRQDAGQRDRPARDERLPPPGTRIERVYQGQRWTLLVGESTFTLIRHTEDGEAHMEFDSISAAGREVTGHRTNGFRFFGLLPGQGPRRITPPTPAPQPTPPTPEPAPPPPAPEPEPEPPTPPAPTPTPPSASDGRDPRLPPLGSTITREYRGRIYRVIEQEDGTFYLHSVAPEGGHFRDLKAHGTFKSLSAAAREITGHRTNGFKFFGLLPGQGPTRRPPTRRPPTPAPTPAPEPPAPAPEPEPTPAPAPEPAAPAGPAYAVEGRESRIFEHGIRLTKATAEQRGEYFRSVGKAIEARADELAATMPGLSKGERVKVAFDELISEHGGPMRASDWSRALDGASRGDSKAVADRACQLTAQAWSKDGAERHGLAAMLRRDRVKVKVNTCTPDRYYRGKFQWRYRRPAGAGLSADWTPGFEDRFGFEIQMTRHHKPRDPNVRPTVLTRRNRSGRLVGYFGYPEGTYDIVPSDGTNVHEMGHFAEERCSQATLPADGEHDLLDHYRTVHDPSAPRNRRQVRKPIQGTTIAVATRDMVVRRTLGDPLVPISSVRGERGRPDEFIKPYIGRQYSETDATGEVFSMGIERVRDAERAAEFIEKDPEHYGLIASIVCGRVHY